MYAQKTSLRAIHLVRPYAEVCPLQEQGASPQEGCCELLSSSGRFEATQTDRASPLPLRAAGAAGILALAHTVKAKPWFTSNTHSSVIHVTNINQMPSSSVSAENDGLPLRYIKQQENEI